ncbi:centrosomal protein of 89 kDa [Aulostomus maculatus]
MLKFSFRREKDIEFKHIAPGLIPAASIAPKAAVPRTPPPRSPNPSPERPRSALAAAILSSSLTGQTWAIPPARPRSFSETDRSESFISEPNFSTALYRRDRWSEDFALRPRLPSPENSEEELEDEEEEENEEDREEHVYQTLDRQENRSPALYALPLNSKLLNNPDSDKMSAPEPAVTSGRRVPSPDLTVENGAESPLVSRVSSLKKASVRKSSGGQKEDVPSKIPNPTTNPPDSCSHAADPEQPSPEPSTADSGAQRDVVQALKQRNTGTEEAHRRLRERVQRLEQELRRSQASSNMRSSAGSQAELQNLRQQAQELVDENDALKLTVHRLNVELSCYQTRFRQLSKQESSRISGLPEAGSPPPWLLDMKYLSPLMLAYEDRMNEKEALLQTTEEEVKRLRVHVEEVIRENEKLHDKVEKIGGVSQKDCHQLQQQACLVLQENQVLIDQLEAQHVRAKADQSKHQSEVSKVTKQLMLLEAEKQHLQEDLEESRREAGKNLRELQILQARLKDAVTWDEHCNITGKLRQQLEQLESKTHSKIDNLHLRVSGLQEEKRSLALDKANLTADIKRMEAELQLARQTNRRAERRMSILKQQKEESLLKEEKTRYYMDAVISVADNISQERDRLLHMASALQQEKQGFISRILKGTVRFGKLQEEVKVYRQQASTRLAALEETAEGRTASYQREISHLQRLLKERQEAEERLLQSKREVEEELEVVWQAASRENQQMKEALLDSRLSGDILVQVLSGSAGPGWSSRAPNDTHTWTEHDPPAPLLGCPRSPGLQGKCLFKFDSDGPDTACDERQSHGLDFYC